MLETWMQTRHSNTVDRSCQLQASTLLEPALGSPVAPQACQEATMKQSRMKDGLIVAV